MNRNYNKSSDNKTMNEYKEGSLMSGTGQHVKHQKKSLAIALNEPRATGEKIPRKSPVSQKKENNHGNS